MMKPCECSSKYSSFRGTEVSIVTRPQPTYAVKVVEHPVEGKVHCPFFSQHNKPSKILKLISSWHLLCHKQYYTDNHRVCGRMVVTKSVKIKHLCKNYADKLGVLFCVSLDQMMTMSTRGIYFCHACKKILMKTSSTVVSYQHRTVVFMGWCSQVYI